MKYDALKLRRRLHFKVLKLRKNDLGCLVEGFNRSEVAVMRSALRRAASVVSGSPPGLREVYRNLLICRARAGSIRKRPTGFSTARASVEAGNPAKASPVETREIIELPSEDNAASHPKKEMKNG